MRISHKIARRIWTVVLVAAFSSGCSDPASLPAGGVVGDPPVAGNSAPTAVFSTNCLLLDCSFDAASSSDVDGSIQTFDWNFGDGTTASGASSNHVFSAAGTYTVSLTVADDDGATGASSQTFSVVAAGQSNNPPTAIFSIACTGLDCNFDAGSSSDSDGVVEGYDWDFGDGATATGQVTNHLFPTIGTFNVILIVTDNGGATSSSSQDIAVTEGGAAQDGQSLYMDRCASCHGPDALGGALARISIVGKTAQEITDAIATVPNMSSLNTLTNEQIQAIAGFLATL